MGSYNGGTTLTFTLDINKDGKDLVYTPTDDRKTSKDTLEILDVMGSNLTLATHQSGYFKVEEYDYETKKVTGTLTAASSEDIGYDQYYVTKVDGEDGKKTYKIIVPDGKALKITYKAVVDAAVGEEPQISNTAYFNYKGLTGDDYTAEINTSQKIWKAEGSTNASATEPYFQIFKQDQWGNPIEGVVFELYKVTLNSNGTVGEKTWYKMATTDATGLVTFDDLDDLENEDAIYCFYETSVPTGYEKSSDPTYFYFVLKDNMKVDGAIGIGYADKVFEVTNNFKSASLTVPLKKTINSQNQTSSSEFKFTLTSTKTPKDAKVYSDEACTSANAVSSFAATIAGSGTTDVETVYFNTVGDYEFTLSENNLSTDQTNEGFAKDDTVYTIKVTVSNDPNTGLYVSSATYQNADGSITCDLLNNDVPAFDNTLTLDAAQVTLEATKKLTGSARESMKEGEFTFKVVEDGVEVTTGRVAADTNNDGSSAIVFNTFEYGADDLGTHILTIYEVEGGDLSITYSDVIFFAIVKVDTVAGSKQLKAEVTYSTQYDSNLDENGKPVFVNNYTPIVIPSGIRLDIIPYAMIAVVAAGVGGLMIVRRRKRS
jgi:pilin isopeptide linkage protein